MLNLISATFLMMFLSQTMGWGKPWNKGVEEKDCAIAKYISGTCGDKTIIEYEARREENQKICFMVEDGECNNPVVDVIYKGDFDGDNRQCEYFKMKYGVDSNGGDLSCKCEGNDVDGFIDCQTPATCTAVSDLVDEEVWSAGELHYFEIYDISNDVDLCPFAGGLDEQVLGAKLWLQITVQCDVADCLIEEICEKANQTIEALDECFCEDQIGAAKNQTIAALDECKCGTEILESAATIIGEIEAAKNETIVELSDCFCTEELLNLQNQTIEGLNDCFCTQEITDSKDAIVVELEKIRDQNIDILDKLDCLKKENEKIKEELVEINEDLECLGKIKYDLQCIKDLLMMKAVVESGKGGDGEYRPSGWGKEIGSGGSDEELFAAQFAAGNVLSENDGGDKVVNFTLDPNTEYSLLAIFLFVVFMTFAGCWAFIKYKN